ncbi:transporter [Alkalicoccobacillus plakortidis]|uniref:Transporter n=1 Tax=Alkalicoccobacillus plakortidis TaxID=444060 RepID=A0ABT0XND5_9BACI|nr:transporter [Alkalicoccobacillus plakortidis]MCM2676843.1 transporter [Alkalicoccobacillus plakortidis]
MYDRSNRIAPPPQGLAPPPAFSPPIPAFQVGPSGIRGCLYRPTYIWLFNGNHFWFFPTFVGRQSVIGYRWSRFGWFNYIIELRQVRSFQCF